MLHVCRIIDVRVVSIIRYMGAGTGGANFFCKVTHNHNLFDFLFSLSRFLISPPPLSICLRRHCAIWAYDNGCTFWCYWSRKRKKEKLDFYMIQPPTKNCGICHSSIYFYECRIDKTCRNVSINKRYEKLPSIRK